jgi:hypothetical protein
MRTCVIEINDAAITASDGETVLLESPGYAIVERDQVLVGKAALRRTRLNPRATYDRFWNQLSLDRLSRRYDKVQHHADLAYHHLAAVWNAIKSDVDEVIFAVPGTFSKKQLGLLLGVAKACAIPAVGLVDAALAAASQANGSGTLWHVDIQLHHTVLTQLHAGARLERVNVHTIPRTGLITMREAWMNAIADAFVRDARFDPTQLAHTEQALYDRLPSWLACLEAENYATLELQTGHATHRINLHRERLIQMTARLYQEIGQHVNSRLRPGESTMLLISHRLAQLPGLYEALSAPSGCRIASLEARATARGVLTNEAYIRCADSALKFVASFPTGERARPRTVSIPRFPATKPTHVVYKGHAYAITDRPLLVGANILTGEYEIDLGVYRNGIAQHHCSFRRQGGEIVVENHSAEGTIVNDRRVDMTVTVGVGDTVKIGALGVELLLIALVEPMARSDAS